MITKMDLYQKLVPPSPFSETCLPKTRKFLKKNQIPLPKKLKDLKIRSKEDAAVIRFFPVIANEVYKFYKDEGVGMVDSYTEHDIRVIDSFIIISMTTVISKGGCGSVRS